MSSSWNLEGIHSSINPITCCTLIPSLPLPVLPSFLLFCTRTILNNVTPPALFPGKHIHCCFVLLHIREDQTTDRVYILLYQDAASTTISNPCLSSQVVRAIRIIVDVGMEHSTRRGDNMCNPKTAKKRHLARSEPTFPTYAAADDRVAVARFA